MEQADWSCLSYTEKNRQLYYQQKRLLDTFLSHHTISKEQYDKSLGDLTAKMGMENEISNDAFANDYSFMKG